MSTNDKPTSEIVSTLPRTAHRFESVKDLFNKTKINEFFVTTYAPAKIGLVKQYATANNWTMELYTDNSTTPPKLYAKRLK